VRFQRLASLRTLGLLKTAPTVPNSTIVNVSISGTSSLKDRIDLQESEVSVTSLCLLL
jgi:hypothetical protein